MTLLKRFWFWGSLVVIFGLSLYMRCLAYGQVYANKIFKFNGVDSYYHIRLIEAMAKNYPQRMYWDVYTIFPSGSAASWPPFFDFIITSVAMLLGLGHPSDYTLNMVAIFAPAVMGALIAVPVFYISYKLFGKLAAIISAGLVAILPGELLGRSVIAATDHHVLETLLVATVGALIIAMNSHKKFYDWRVILCGITLGLYMLTWNGAELILLIMAVFVGIKSVFYRKSVMNFSVVFGIALVMNLIWLNKVSEVPRQYAILVLLTIIPSILDILNYKLPGKRYLLVLLGLGSFSAILAYLLSPDIIGFVVTQLSFVFSWTKGITLMEMQPILYPGAGTKLDFSIIWGNLTTTIFFSLIAFVIFLYKAITRKLSSELCFLFIWSAMMCLAMLGQRRFAYYYAVNAAILTGLVVNVFWAKIIKHYYDSVPKKLRSYRDGLVPKILYIVIVVIVTIGPNINAAIATASNSSFLPSDGWYEALTWLRDNSPEPFSDPKIYYTDYDETFKYPDTAYSVMSWWDYGHWITQIAKRIPNASPSSYGICPTFFSSRNETLTNQYADDLKVKYIVIDNAMAIGKYYAIVALSSSRVSLADYVDPTIYYEVCYMRDGNNLKPIMLYYAGYYDSALVRMYNFNCLEYIPTSSTVVTLENRTSTTGVDFKLITNVQSFSNWEDAVNYAKENPNRKLASPDPFASPVKVEALKGYKLVHSSPQTINGIEEVKIFEREIND